MMWKRGSLWTDLYVSVYLSFFLPPSASSSSSFCFCFLTRQNIYTSGLYILVYRLAFLLLLSLRHILMQCSAYIYVKKKKGGK